MANESMVGKVQTVLGAVEPSALGMTLTHEHLLIDLSQLFAPPVEAGARATYYAPLTQETLSRIRHYHEANLENYRLLDVGDAIDALGLYAQHGGGAVVDATSIGIARDPIGLARISRATGVNVIMGAAFYVDDAHPDWARRASADELAERIIRDVAEGVDGTGIRSGVIGEVGCSWPLTPNERKVLKASAKAQRATGAPILIHPGRGEQSPMQIIEALDKAGADLSRTIIGHLDRTVFKRETLTAIAESGCWFEWDLFGSESSYYRLNPSILHPNDGMKLADIRWLIAQGCGRRIVIAHDICSRHRLAKYGGHGYHYIPEHVVPMMRAGDFSDEMIGDILINNPANILAFAAPK